MFLAPNRTVAMKIGNNTTLAKAAKLDGNHACGRGCYLSIRGGSKRWVYRFFSTGKSHEVPLGSFPAMSLAEARIAADGLRHARKVDKVDPRLASKAKAAKLPTLNDDTMTYYEYMHRTWDERHAAIWLSSIERYVLKTLGDRDTASLTTTDIVELLTPLWTTMNFTALRVHGRVRAVIEHAIGTDDVGRFKNGNPADRALKRLPRGVGAPETPHPAPTWEEAPAFYAALAASLEPVAIAIRFLMLCCTPRTAEVLAARWSEIEGDMWHVPGVRVKGKKQDKARKIRDIPLSQAALDVLAELDGSRDPDAFIFAGRDGRWEREVYKAFCGHIEKNALQTFVKDKMGLPWHIHGLRSSFRSWATFHARTPAELIAAELALDHKVGDKVQRAYDRETLLLARRNLAARWAAHLLGKKEAA
jgi:integrase